LIFIIAVHTNLLSYLLFQKKKFFASSYGSDGITDAVPYIAKLHARNPTNATATPAIAILPAKSWPGVFRIWDIGEYSNDFRF
jgi:hypothetical protein